MGEAPVAFRSVPLTIVTGRLITSSRTYRLRSARMHELFTPGRVKRGSGSAARVDPGL